MLMKALSIRPIAIVEGLHKVKKGAQTLRSKPGGEQKHDTRENPLAMSYSNVGGGIDGCAFVSRGAISITIDLPFLEPTQLTAKGD